MRLGFNVLHCAPLSVVALDFRGPPERVQARKKVVSLSCDNSMCPGIDKEEEEEE